MSGGSEQFEGKQVAANANQLQLARGMACSAAGCVAGVLGLNWMYGFLLYCVVAVAMGFVMLIATRAVGAHQKPPIARHSYIPSTFTFFTQGLFPSLMVCSFFHSFFFCSFVHSTLVTPFLQHSLSSCSGHSLPTLSLSIESCPRETSSLFFLLLFLIFSLFP